MPARHVEKTVWRMWIALAVIAILYTQRLQKHARKIVPKARRVQLGAVYNVLVGHIKFQSEVQDVMLVILTTTSLHWALSMQMPARYVVQIKCQMGIKLDAIALVCTQTFQEYVRLVVPEATRVHLEYVKNVLVESTKLALEMRNAISVMQIPPFLRSARSMQLPVRHVESTVCKKRTRLAVSVLLGTQMLMEHVRQIVSKASRI